VPRLSEVEPIVVVGTVTDTKDPQKLGRVKVKVEGFGATLELPWLRVMNVGASNQFGWSWLPEKDDEVLVLKGAGNQPAGMFVLGSLYSGKNKPKTPDADGKNDTKQIVTRAGHELTFLDKDGGEKITLKTKDGKLCIEFDKAGGKVTITGDQEITLTSNGKAVVNAKEISFKGDTKLEIDAKQVSIKGDAVVVDGKNVDVKGMVNLG
jgi:phage baseplate assembly protein gpV